MQPNPRVAPDPSSPATSQGMAAQQDRPGAARFEKRVQYRHVVSLLSLLTSAALVAACAVGAVLPGWATWSLYSAAAVGLVAGLAALRRRSNAWAALAWCAAAAGCATLAVTWNPAPTLRADLAASLVRDLGLVLLLAGGLAAVRIVSAARGGLLCGAVLAGLLIANSTLAVRNDGQEKWNDIRWIGDGWSRERHPQIGEVLQPWGWMKAYYPSDPRGYFEQEVDSEDVDMRCWAAAPISCRMLLQRPATRSGTLSWRTHDATNEFASGLIEQGSVPLLQSGGYCVRLEARSEEPCELVCRLLKSEPQGSVSVVDHRQRIGDWTTVEGQGEFRGAPGEGRLTLSCPATAGQVEIRGVRIECDVPRQSRPARHAVAYLLNDRGFRDEMRALEHPEGMLRVALLGDSFTFGFGVHQQDCLSRLLQTNLKSDAESGRRYEVLNFGVTGYSARQSVAGYEHFAAAYRPQVVVFLTTMGDGVTPEQDRELNIPLANERMQRATGPARQMYVRQFDELMKRRQEIDRSCLAELRRLGDLCRRDGARLMVVVYRISAAADWAAFAEDVVRDMQTAGIPAFDLFPAVAQGRAFEELVVHPVDAHPNHVANALAAAEIERRLRELGWLDGDAQATPAEVEVDPDR